MRGKSKRAITGFMGLMTLFMSVFTLTYTVMYCKSLMPKDTEKDHSGTLYRRLAAYGSDTDPGDFEENNISVNKEESIADKSIPINETSSVADSSGAYSENTSFGEIQSVTVQNADTGVIFTMPLENYVECTVLAEMPTNAPIEALKAQAVASRTLAVRFICDSDKRAHNGADICTSSAHCQGYIDINEFSRQYGETASRTVSNIKDAVSQTAGTVLFYGGEPIVAAFHASSGARTASGKEAWGGDVAYLVSVETDEMYNDALKNQVISTVSFSRDSFIKKLSEAGIQDLEQYRNQPFTQWVSGITRTDSGRAASVTVAGNVIEGDRLRKILGLKSCDFSISYGEDNISFTTVGYGHGVGMSQLGAVSMAMRGESFHAILSRYYPGCSARIM